jgi:hypothetical protein
MAARKRALDPHGRSRLAPNVDNRPTIPAEFYEGIIIATLSAANVDAKPSAFLGTDIVDFRQKTLWRMNVTLDLHELCEVDFHTCSDWSLLLV